MTVKLSIRDASFGYGSSETVWENINIDVKDGECLCLLGPNGCGKTTLFNCINGNYQLKTGQILLNGKDVREFGVSELARTLGIVFQEHSAPFPYTALEVVRMGRTPHLGMFSTPDKKDTEHAYSIMEELGIAHLAGKRYTQISGGERLKSIFSPVTGWSKHRRQDQRAIGQLSSRRLYFLSPTRGQPREENWQRI